MKTTIDIADDLIDRARIIQARDQLTLRALVEEGLRLTLEKRAKPVKPYKYVPVIVGEPYRAGMPVPDVSALIAETYAERESGVFAANGASGASQRVAEPGPAYNKTRRTTKRQKRE